MQTNTDWSLGSIEGEFTFRHTDLKSFQTLFKLHYCNMEDHFGPWTWIDHRIDSKRCWKHYLEILLHVAAHIGCTFELRSGDFGEPWINFPVNGNQPEMMLVFVSLKWPLEDVTMKGSTRSVWHLISSHLKIRNQQHARKLFLHRTHVFYTKVWSQHPHAAKSVIQSKHPVWHQHLFHNESHWDQISSWLSKHIFLLWLSLCSV